MTKTIKICDLCEKEVDWLYKIPWIYIEGYTIDAREGEKELCKNCTEKWLDYIQRDYFKERKIKK